MMVVVVVVMAAELLAVGLRPGKVHRQVTPGAVPAGPGPCAPLRGAVAPGGRRARGAERSGAERRLPGAFEPDSSSSCRRGDGHGSVLARGDPARSPRGPAAALRGGAGWPGAFAQEGSAVPQLELAPGPFPCEEGGGGRGGGNESRWVGLQGVSGSVF